MKKIFILLFATAFSFYQGFSQVQATLKAGSVPNSVYITIKPSVTLTAARFSTFQFTLGLPAAQSSGLSASITSLDPGLAYPPSLNSTETVGASSFAIYIFSGDGGSGAATTYSAGVEYNYAEVFFSGANVSVNDLRIMQLPGGGTTGQANFYVASSGTDVTNQATQFYAPLPANYSNDGSGYAGTSWARLASSLIVVPVKFDDFTVIKKANDALLSWSVENESSITDRYEIERSLNGVDFTKFNIVASKYAGNSSNSYTLTDYNLSSLNAHSVIYYRIKQVDKDAKSVYTQIKSVRLDGKTFAANVYPNPVVNSCTVSIDLANDSKISIILSDAAGKQIQALNLAGFKGLNTYPLNVAKLSQGAYVVKVIAGAETQTIPVIKDK